MLRTAALWTVKSGRKGLTTHRVRVCAAVPAMKPTTRALAPRPEAASAIVTVARTMLPATTGMVRLRKSMSLSSRASLMFPRPTSSRSSAASRNRMVSDSAPKNWAIRGASATATIVSAIVKIRFRVNAVWTREETPFSAS